MPDEMQAVSVERRGNVAVIALDRPERRNAMLPALMEQLAEAVRERASAAAAIVLTGHGPAFCVGADLHWLGSQPDAAEGVGRLVAAHHAAVRALRTAPVPVLAAVNGAAAGGGMSLALAADYRVAARVGASFTAAYFRLGLVPDGGNAAFFARMLGPARAMDLLLTNRRLSADDALRLGLVSEVVDDDALLDHACERAAAFAGIPGATLVATRRLLDAAGGGGLDAWLDEEEAAMRAAANRPEFAAALRAFLHRPRRA